jgi:hypothetical protein
MIGMNVHTCVTCGQNKEELDFYTFKRIKVCKKCNNIRHYQNHKKHYLDKGDKRRSDPAAKERMRKYDREWKARERANNPEQRIRDSLRGRLRCVLKGIRKYVHLKDCLGCDIKVLISYIEGQWESGMSWENYGKKRGEWSVDHIKPMSAFNLTLKEEQLKCNHYTNLRPMWVIENCRKGDRF